MSCSWICSFGDTKPSSFHNACQEGSKTSSFQSPPMIKRSPSCCHCSWHVEMVHILFKRAGINIILEELLVVLVIHGKMTFFIFYWAITSDNPCMMHIFLQNQVHVHCPWPNRSLPEDATWYINLFTISSATPQPAILYEAVHEYSRWWKHDKIQTLDIWLPKCLWKLILCHTTLTSTDAEISNMVVSDKTS